MLPAAAPTGRVTPEEYLAFDRASEAAHEYVDGEIRAMTGASREHGLIVGAVFASLYAQFGGRPCEVFTHGIRVRIPVTRNYVYPDVTIACGGTRLEDEEHDTVLNPAVVIEVLSPSTASYDRTQKWEMYRRIPTLRDYLLVSQKEPRVERYTRYGDQGLWLFGETAGLDASIELESVGCVLRLAEIYERVFPAAEAAAEGYGSHPVLGIATAKRTGERRLLTLEEWKELDEWSEARWEFWRLELDPATREPRPEELAEYGFVPGGPRVIPGDLVEVEPGIFQDVERTTDPSSIPDRDQHG